MFSLYNQSLALLTDLYEINMAYAYWKSEMAQDEAVFHLFFRRKPFNGGYTVAAGLENVIAFLQNWHFDPSDLEYLASFENEEGQPLYDRRFLETLSSLKFTCDVDAVQEGDVVFPYEPLIRIKGPILQAQLLETALLNFTNFATLIATKAARISQAAAGDEILEFGLRRAQGVDGAMTATRSSFIGGCTATSNTLGGKLLNIPIKGTHAHSWVMAFDSELTSFAQFAKALPDQSVFLVDTYDTLQGVKNAITVGHWLRERGKKLLGIRLDSGDLHYLSLESRKLLDAAGFQETQIYASNELDETLISDLKRQGAKIAVWGVGTHLVTGNPQPALDGVYKLAAYRKKGEEKWQYKLKLSERLTKISDPGILQVRRFQKGGAYIADALYDQMSELGSDWKIVDPFDPTRTRQLSANLKFRDLLQPIFRGGELVYQSPSLQSMQGYCKQELARFDAGIKRVYNPHAYPVGMEQTLYEQKLKLVDQIRETLL